MLLTGLDNPPCFTNRTCWACAHEPSSLWVPMGVLTGWAKRVVTVPNSVMSKADQRESTHAWKPIWTCSGCSSEQLSSSDWVEDLTWWSSRDETVRNSVLGTAGQRRLRAVWQPNRTCASCTYEPLSFQEWRDYMVIWRSCIRNSVLHQTGINRQ